MSQRTRQGRRSRLWYPWHPAASPVHVLLLSTYELGHQPLGLARPAAHLAAAGHTIACTDLAVEPLDEHAVRGASLVAISVPMHTATRLAVPLAGRVRALNPAAHICFYGLYASPNAPTLLGRYADSVIGGELETPLVDLANRLAGSPSASPVGGIIASTSRPVDRADGSTYLGRQQFLLPRRDLLPPLERYAHLDDGRGQRKPVGYVEATRGCAHRCRHCPIPSVYAGRLRAVQESVVLEDVQQLVRMGARHITFGDPDFFNGVRHSIRIVEALHAAFPDLTYDVTSKVEHLLEHRELLPVLARTGCAFVVSAVESVDDTVLHHLAKGHTAADVETALALAADAGLVLRPTFVAFTPWTTLEGYLDLLDFVARQGLVHHVDPIQLAIRLLIPRGSLLLAPAATATNGLAPLLEPFDDAALAYPWHHPDPRMDRLQRQQVAIVEQGIRDGTPADRTFTRLLGQAGQADCARLSPRTSVTSMHPPRPGAAVPRLTEPWFC